MTRMMKNSRPLDRCGYTVVTVNPSPAQCNEANIDPFIDCSGRVIEDFLVRFIDTAKVKLHSCQNWLFVDQSGSFAVRMNIVQQIYIVFLQRKVAKKFQILEMIRVLRLGILSLLTGHSIGLVCYTCSVVRFPEFLHQSILMTYMTTS